MPTADYLEDRAHELLTAATTSLTLARTGNAVPSRIYLSHGPPAVDFCTADGLLTVYADTPAIKLVDPKADRSKNVGQIFTLPIYRLVVELWRCVPNLDAEGTPPTAAALDASATGLLRDLHALQTGLFLHKWAGTLFPAGMGCADPEISDPIPRNPEGSVAGWLIRVAIPLNDAGPVL